MKQSIFNKFFLGLMMILGIISCDDRELITVEQTAAPTLIDLSADKLFLDQNYQSNPVLTLTWSPAEYNVPTEIKYDVEVSSDEAFSAPVTLANVASSQRSVAFNTKQVNDAATTAGLVPNEEQTLYFRVVSYIGAKGLKTPSNVTSLLVTPYIVIKEFPKFYLVGGASVADWSPNDAIELQQNEYKNYIYTYLENSKSFRFLGQKAWDGLNYSIDAPSIRESYRFFTSLSDILVPDTKEDENIIFEGESGIYKIEINADPDVKTIKVTKANFDLTVSDLYLVGNVAGNGWTPDTASQLTKSAEGIFTIEVSLATGDEFKFINQKNWDGLDWGNLTGSLSGYLAPKGDNENIKFEGESGTYVITVNLKAGSYKFTKK